jgi:AcrR family transcriptional regulator
MGSAERRARENAQTRERILVAARDLFAREGVQAVTMRAIASRIEYTAAALYSHFKDKHELICALCEQDFGALRRAFELPRTLTDPVERVRRLGHAYVSFAFAHPHHYRFMFMTAKPEIEEGAHDGAECGRGDPDRDAYALLRAEVASCIRAGRFARAYRDESEATQALWGAAHGVVSLHLIHGDDPWLTWKNARKSALMLVDAAVTGMLDPAAGPAPRRAKARPSRRARAAS